MSLTKIKTLGIIPARYGSTRFEGKPLKEINGDPIIKWVYKRIEKSKLDKVVVATDDERIFDAVRNFGGNVIMTSKDHQNGTSRIVEVVNSVGYDDFDFVVNVQGDEPLIKSHEVDMIIDSYEQDKSEIITLKTEIKNDEDIHNPNIVKVISDFQDNAIYFSRYAIPFNRDGIVNCKYYKHIGIYGYTTKFLNELKNLKDGVIEKFESLEQLKFMENGYKIKVLETNAVLIGVDVPDDLSEVRKYILENNITL